MIQAQGGTSAGESHAQLWNRLFAECPDRHRQKVINIARKKFHNFVARGTWTAEQDAELAMLIDIHGTKWSKIAALINRHPEDLRDRYRNYVICGDSQRKDAWTEQEEQSLAHHVIENMAEIDRLRITQPDRILLQKTYEELIDWQDISERMGRTRSRLQCITKWKAMNMKTHGKDQLASLQPDSQVTFHLDKARRQIEDMPATERYRLLLAIRDCKSTSDATIAWSRLLDKDYRSQWHRGTMGLLWHRLKKTVPGHQSKPIRDCAQQLISEYDHSGELPFVDGDGYSDIEEMQVVQATADPVRVGRQKQKREKSKTSEDLVGTSDDEEDEAEEAQDGGMQIDPALMSEGAEAAPEDGIEYEPEDEPTATHKKSTPRKKTSAKRGANTSTKKRASTKKGMLSQDPIEDDEPAQDEAAAPQGEDADAVEDTPRKKRASTRAGRSKKRDAAPLPPPPESSDMEDMGDVPARIPA